MERCEVVRDLSTEQILAIIKPHLPLTSAPLAQLDRASGYEPEGREFESLRAHHSNSLNYKHLLLVLHPRELGNTGEQVEGFQLKTQTSLLSRRLPECFIILNVHIEFRDVFRGVPGHTPAYGF